MAVTGQIVLNKDGLQTNGKNYKIAAISNKTLEKSNTTLCNHKLIKYTLPNCVDNFIKTIMKQILAKPSKYQITIIFNYIKA